MTMRLVWHPKRRRHVRGDVLAKTLEGYSSIFQAEGDVSRAAARSIYNATC